VGALWPAFDSQILSEANELNKLNPGEADYSTEFELVLACLSWPQAMADGERIRLIAQQPVRWPQVLAIAQHHKVVPLFLRNLEAFAADYIPDEVGSALQAATTANAQVCAQRTTHLAALSRLFREQQIDFRIFKGVPLAVAAYGDPTLRDAGDIDLLVAEKDIFAAGEVLRGEWYFRFEPQARLTPRRLRSYVAHQKDFSYEHPGAGVIIDLHWRLFRNAWLPANATLDEVGEDWLELGPEQIPTLPAPRLLLYLCVHGALDGWLRLKWLADISALMHTMTEEQIAATVAMATEWQALPELSAAILLCDDLLGPHALPPGCLDANNKRVARIMRFGKQLMTSNDYCPIREKIPSPQWFLNELLLHPSPRYRRDLFERSLFRPRVWRWLSLPDSLFPLYAVLSPFEWVVFHVHHRWTMRKRPEGPRRRGFPFGRIMRTRPVDLALAFEAGCMLTFFRIALSFLPMQKLTAWMSRAHLAAPSLSARRQAQILRRIEWSIDAVVRHAPLTFVCFPQCLAAYFMLRRRHIASKLFYGVTRDEDQLKAHTWVKVGDHTIAGGDVESRFTVLTTFP
jgi:hypothetical protein